MEDQQLGAQWKVIVTAIAFSLSVACMLWWLISGSTVLVKDLVDQRPRISYDNALGAFLAGVIGLGPVAVSAIYSSVTSKVVSVRWQKLGIGLLLAGGAVIVVLTPIGGFLLDRYLKT